MKTICQRMRLQKPVSDNVFWYFPEKPQPSDRTPPLQNLCLMRNDLEIEGTPPKHIVVTVREDFSCSEAYGDD